MKLGSNARGNPQQLHKPAALIPPCCFEQRKDGEIRTSARQLAGLGFLRRARAPCASCPSSALTVFASPRRVTTPASCIGGGIPAVPEARCTAIHCESHIIGFSSSTTLNSSGMLDVLCTRRRGSGRALSPSAPTAGSPVGYHARAVHRQAGKPISLSRSSCAICRNPSFR